MKAELIPGVEELFEKAKCGLRVLQVLLTINEKWIDASEVCERIHHMFQEYYPSSMVEQVCQELTFNSYLNNQLVQEVTRCYRINRKGTQQILRIEKDFEGRDDKLGRFVQKRYMPRII